MQDSAGLGAMLRECREAKGLSVDDLSRATRILPRQVVALEGGRLRDLPAPVFVRGFIRAYCAAVSEPAERALAVYETWVEATRTPTPVPATVLVDSPPRHGIRWRVLGPQLLVAGVLVVVGGAVYLLVSSAATRYSDGARPPGSTVTPAAPVPPTPAPATAPALAAVPPDGGPSPSPAPRESAAHVLIARVHEPTWLSVRADDGAASQELLEPGTVREWRSAGRFTLTVGNAGGVTLELDGVALPPLGERGQVIRDVRVPREVSQ
jgi:hypothetical protein